MNNARTVHVRRCVRDACRDRLKPRQMRACTAHLGHVGGVQARQRVPQTAVAALLKAAELSGRLSTGGF